MKKVIIVVGTRPNFVKISKFKKLNEIFNEKKFEILIVHTGQHYDEEMSKIFFKQLDIMPDITLTLTSTFPAEKVGEMILKLSAVFKKEAPDFILTVGDVDSTLAAGIAANKLNIKQGHIESGLRSKDLSMPEEINRIIVDKISDYHFITDIDAKENLSLENIDTNNTFFVGNTMIDTLINFQDSIDDNEILNKYELDSNNYILATFHRPSNVDNSDRLNTIVTFLNNISNKIKIVLPVHPRTLKKLKETHLDIFSNSQIIFSGPLDYFSFQKLIKNSKGVITDSGGIQEETTFYNIPCITIRPNTERPVTVNIGSNVLTEDIDSRLLELVEKMLQNQWKVAKTPENWDGNSTKRILEIINKVI